MNTDTESTDDELDALANAIDRGDARTAGALTARERSRTASAAPGPGIGARRPRLELREPGVWVRPELRTIVEACDAREFAGLRIHQVRLVREAPEQTIVVG